MSKLPMPKEEPSRGPALDSRLADLVVERGLVLPDEVEAARTAVRSSGRPLGEQLVGDGCLAPRQLERLLVELDAERMGKRLPGFALIEKIGSGSSATVLKAKQLNLDRLVAIKVLAKGALDNPGVIARFKDEARRAAKLNHANIVQVFDVGQSGEAIYIVMEYVAGQTVHDLVQERGRLEEVEALDLVIAMGEALGHAHAQGLVHRDVKPKNIILTPSGVPKLADLGLAREIADREAGLAERGQTYGTPYYISPEQVRGDVDIGPPADIYSLGATFYLMLTGRVPFQGDSSKEVMEKHRLEPVTPPLECVPALSPGVSEVVCHMMSKRAEERYPDCESLLVELRAWRAYHVLKAGERGEPKPGVG